MKILQVNKFYFPWIGGIETIVQQLAEGLKNDSNFETEVLCCNSKRQDLKEDINGIKVCRAGIFGIVLSMPISLSFFIQFKKMSSRADIIDLHHPFPLGFLAYWLFRPKAKLVIHYHSDIVRQKLSAWLLNPIIKSVLNKANKIFVSSPNLINSSKLLQEFKEKCHVIHFGVDLNSLDKIVDINKVDELKNKYKNFVLFVGRLSYYKGIDYLIDAMVKVNYNLVIIGNGDRSHLIERVKSLGIENRVYFLSDLTWPELVNFYKAAKVFVLPSIYRSEAFGLVILEAMACGTPAITTELGTGTSYVNKAGETGLVVPPMSSEALSKAISDMLKNESVLSQMGVAARKRIEDMFNQDEVINNYKKVILEVGLNSN